ncbi:MAG: hypothetical protein ABIU87_00260 [Ornithinibacter sp.]
MELRKAVPLIGLGTLLVVDAALIVWAFRAAEVPDATSNPTPSVSASASPGAPPSGSSSATPTGDAKALEPAPTTRLVAAVSSSVAWVAEAGTCKDGGTLWSTDDGGKTWTVSDTPGRVMRPRPDSAKAGFFTGGDKDCALKLWATGDSGSSWSSPQGAAKAWSRVADDAASVHTPSDSLVTPCPKKADVLDLSTVSGGRADVLCADGTARRTTNGGGTWSTTFTVEAALAMTVVDTGGGVLMKADPTCAGAVAVPLIDGKPDVDGTCVEARATSGQVSVTGAGKAWWLVIGDQAFRADQAAGPWTATGATLSR